MGRNTEKGFTLIEVMVALVIVAIGLLAMANMLIVGIKSNHVSEQRMDFSALAQSAMENIKQKAVAGYSANTAKADVAAQLNAVATATITPSVVFNPDPLVQGAAGIVLTLQWDDHGNTKSVVLRDRVVVP